MARIEQEYRYCQNALCRARFSASVITWPPQPNAVNNFREMKVCPECGFKTGSAIDHIGIKKALEDDSASA